ncbi:MULTISPECIES: hypothetical protein [unclassified Pseudomonas]|uniref:hypothetical protein n=1 Tax=unclassified Pseudomonas TaxID=196821 RepID=UPI00255761DB|nr:MULTISPECIES: hypothetical protein [unclassified Pseudomonas]
MYKFVSPMTYEHFNFKEIKAFKINQLEKLRTSIPSPYQAKQAGKVRAVGLAGRVNG